MSGWSAADPVPRRPPVSVCADPTLSGVLGQLTAGSGRSWAAAVVDLRVEPAVRMAWVGCDPGTRFEIGSMSKALTGMLGAQLIAEQAVTMQTAVGRLLPALAGSALAGVTVAELVTHTSGLPRMGTSWRSTIRVVLGVLTGADPYRRPTVEAVLRSAASQPLRGRGGYRYSNLGGAVLGQALAAAAGTSYELLLRDRVLGPLAMSDTGVGMPGRCAAPGWSRQGRRQQPWLLGGYAPAGGVVATIGDMTRLLVGLLDGSAPGVGALDPVLDLGAFRAGRSSGLFWVIDQPGDGAEALTWHNGQTGGYSAFIGLHRAARSGVVVLADTADAARIGRLARQLTPE